MSPGSRYSYCAPCTRIRQTMPGKEFEERVRRFRKMPVPVRVVYARPRTFISILIGIVAFFLLPGSLRLVTRALLGWDTFVAFYLVLVFVMVFRSGVRHVRRNAV